MFLEISSNLLEYQFSHLYYLDFNYKVYIRFRFKKALDSGKENEIKKYLKRMSFILVIILMMFLLYRIR